jgi:EAL domain-containing protein (putative c-di-GMP-specific phosphodiesterase class I)
MCSSTLAPPATSTLRLRVAGAPALGRRRYGSGLADALSTPAGLHPRPWLARLGRALERDSFAVHYQPIVSLADGRPSHHEALVRLADDPSGALIMPARFLPAAERYGLIRDIDRLVLERVLRMLAARDDGMRVAINLSTLSVTDPAMLTHVARRLDRHGVDPSRLLIEITETAAICDMDRARAFCRGVSELGCQIALDDFGTGFGSLQYLRHLPFDYLKIDGSFIHALLRSRTDRLVVRALVDLARGMGARTIAEYVTDRATLEMLRRLGVDCAQGYELGRPMPPGALDRLQYTF